MNIPQARRAQEEGGRNMPRAYNDDFRRRGEQERLDEAFARRLVLGMGDDDYNIGEPGREPGGLGAGLGDILGIGNAAGHFLNHDFVRTAQNILGRNFGQTVNAADYLVADHTHNAVEPDISEPRRESRRHTRGHVDIRLSRGSRARTPTRTQSTVSRLNSNAGRIRTSERVLPRRTITDYQTEAATHRLEAERGPRDRYNDRRRPSAMAGLTANTHAGRIGTWLDHVEDDPVDMITAIPVR